MEERVWNETIAIILPNYLAAAAQEGFVKCYVHKEVSQKDLDAGFEEGLDIGKGLARLLHNESIELDRTINGARNYQKRSSGYGRPSFTCLGIEFESHSFLYGFFHGLEISTTIIVGRKTEVDIANAFGDVIKKFRDHILPLADKPT